MLIQLFLQTDPSKIINASITFTTGTYFNGKLTTGDYKIQFAPSPHVSFMGEWNQNYFTRVGLSSTTKTIDLWILQARLALNSRLQFTGLYQKNTVNQSNAYNLRLAWEFSPLSYVYLIYNRGVNSQLTAPQSITQVENHMIFKISYFQQF